MLCGPRWSFHFLKPLKLIPKAVRKKYCGVIRAPVHIVTGSAGCQEGRDHFLNNEPKWSAFRSQDFGYTRFKAFNNTHIYMEQVSVDLHGQVIDSFWLIKNGTISFS